VGGVLGGRGEECGGVSREGGGGRSLVVGRHGQQLIDCGVHRPVVRPE